MAEADDNRVEITPEHEEEARQLRRLWTEFRTARKAEGEPVSQGAFGAAYDIGTQGAVWQFMNAKRPLSMKAAKGFREGFGVEIGVFSPRLQAELDELTGKPQGVEGAPLTLANEFRRLPETFADGTTKEAFLRELLAVIWRRPHLKKEEPSASPNPPPPAAPKKQRGRARDR